MRRWRTMLAGDGLANYVAEPLFQWGTAKSAALLKSRIWPQVSVYHLHRPAGEMSWLNAQHRISLQLEPLRDAEVSIENSRPRHLRSLSPLSFSPAGMPIKTVMGAGTAVAILQKPEAYGDLAAEISVHGDLIFEPIWSLEDPVLERLVRLILREADSGFVDNLLIDTLNRATALQILRRFSGPDLRLAPVGALAGNRLSRVVDYIDDH